MSKSNPALIYHQHHRRKLKPQVTVPILNEKDLKLLYTPGVAEACKVIAQDFKLTGNYTAKASTVAMISNGTAVLGLGNVGPYASMPVLESKAALLAHFTDLSVMPMAVHAEDPDTLIHLIKCLEPSFGLIFLEDIAAPHCVTIEERLQAELNIPVYHDDQHGTAMVVLAALINALKSVEKDKVNVRVVLLGTGAAGSAILRLLKAYGFNHIDAFNQDGYLFGPQQPSSNSYIASLQSLCSKNPSIHRLEDAMKDADVFIGVSKGNLVDAQMITSMARDAIVLPLANPIPEIEYQTALDAGARIVGTGSFAHPNQINNLLAFPGFMKGVLQSGTTQITTAMKIKTAEVIASLVSDEDIKKGQIVPSVFESKLVDKIAQEIIALVHLNS